MSAFEPRRRRPPTQRLSKRSTVDAVNHRVSHDPGLSPTRVYRSSSSRNPLRVDVLIAISIAVVILVIEPGVAVAAIVAAILLLACAISFLISRRRRRRREFRPRR
jgi:Flp pilus assembly protein TadB